MLNIQASRTFYIEYTIAEDRRSTPPVNFYLDLNGTVYLPADFRTKGNRREPLVWNGLVVGVYNYTLPEDKVLNLGVHASNGQMVDGSYISVPEEGNLHRMIALITIVLVLFMNYNVGLLMPKVP